MGVASNFLLPYFLDRKKFLFVKLPRTVYLVHAFIVIHVYESFIMTLTSPVSLAHGSSQGQIPDREGEGARKED